MSVFQNYQLYTAEFKIDKEVEDDIVLNITNNYKWYCPQCGVYRKQEIRFHSECMECGNKLESD